MKENGMKNPVDIPLERCPDGYLKHPEEWDEEVAKLLASEWKGFEFKDEHLPILYFIREHYEEHQTTPDVREATNYIVKKDGLDKKSAKKKLFKMFPHGYMQQGCQLAGMRRPTAWCVG
ncbi:MAG: TusE/DsrC/DsvC family sulfur relay protein [Cocleimonas sp.]|nr:TusE/DsrC/DsvC family sulfur relay protein [Cocleimonas sp.]